MNQPSGFVESYNPTHVCQLHKVIYVLKQTSRAWFSELKSYLLASSFTMAHSYNSSFIYICSGGSLYLLVYVDDLIVTGSSSLAINQFVECLDNRFSLKTI